MILSSLLTVLCNDNNDDDHDDDDDDNNNTINHKIMCDVCLLFKVIGNVRDE